MNYTLHGDTVLVKRRKKLGYSKLKNNTTRKRAIAKALHLEG